MVCLNSKNSRSRKKKDFFAFTKSLPGDTVKVQKDFWSSIWALPFEDFYSMIGNGLVTKKKTKSRRK
jgi:hypothetical protein